MSWIKIQNGLVTNKKTARLAGQMKWKKLEAIGFMVSFWIWALENCEDGQLKDISDNEIAFAVGMDSAPGILEALKVSGFVDNKPLRIHDWPEYQHEFLRAKYRREPEKHQKIMDLYRRSTGTNTDRKTDRQIDSKKETTCSENKDIPKDIIKEEAVKRKETAEAYIVRQFKIALGVPEFDKDWDKACFVRNAKAAVSIIGAFQNDKVYATEWARKKIEHWQEWAKETGKSFSLERIAIEAQNDKGKYLEEKARIEKYQRQEGNNDKQHTTAKMGTDYAVGQVKDSGLTQIGKAITPNINKPKEC